MQAREISDPELKAGMCSFAYRLILLFLFLMYNLISDKGYFIHIFNFRKKEGRQ